MDKIDVITYTYVINYNIVLLEENQYSNV